VRPFLAVCGRPDLVDAAGLAGARRSHTIFPVLSDDDERLVLQACASEIVSAWDAVITLLAFTTGLRACDIIGLRLVDVDWRARTAGIVQQKTGNPLRVPLTDLVVDRLVCYLLDHQPGSCDDHVFLRCKAVPQTISEYLTDRISLLWDE